MGGMSRNKGAGFEREVATLLREHKIPVTRTGEYNPHDLLVCLDGVERIWECKRRARGFSGLYGFIENAWAVVHRDDRQAPLITIRLSDFLALARRDA